MRFIEKCLDCSKRQGTRIYDLSLKQLEEQPSAAETEAFYLELNDKIDNADPDISPAALTLIAIRMAERHAGVDDPFRDIKVQNNEMALALYDELNDKIKNSDAPLHLACQLAACGNIIDLGVHDDFDIHATIAKVLREGFMHDDFAEFVRQCDELNEKSESARLLYLCDNAGEIVFDRLFIEELKRQYPEFKITAVVRGTTVLNDATMEDARAVGLDKVVPVIDNGKAELGTMIEKLTNQLRDDFLNADIIISKGQANYETLCSRSENIFFILKAKCDVVAQRIGVKLWDAVMVHNK